MLEALIGGVPEDDDELAEAPIVRCEAGSFVVDGLLGASEMREHLGPGTLPGEEEDYLTVGGMVMDALACPSAGTQTRGTSYEESPVVIMSTSKMAESGTRTARKIASPRRALCRLPTAGPSTSR